MKNITAVFLLCGFSLSGFSEEKRDILQRESVEIGLEEALIKDFPETGFPTYRDRDFWETIPGNLRDQYIREAEESHDIFDPVIHFEYGEESEFEVCDITGLRGNCVAIAAFTLV